MPLFMIVAEGGGRQRPADHAGRPHPLERPAGRAGARRDAGAGRSCRVADRASTYDAEPSITAFDGGQGQGHRAGPCSWASRCTYEIGDAEAALAAAPHKVDQTYTHAAPQPQCDRAARRDGRLGRRRRCASTTPSQLVAHTAWSLGAGVRHRRGAGPRHLAVVGGGFGGKGLWEHQILGAAAAKLAGRPVRHRCCRARACTASSAGAR